MSRLLACPACHGFLANPRAACPHCDAAPPPRRRLMSAIASVLLATAGSITLMACYGVSPDYYPCEDGTCDDDCYIDLDCDVGEYCNVDSLACEWGGTCGTSDVPCPDGYACDEARSTCVPDDAACATDGECAWGSERCDVTTGACVPATYCAPGQLGCAEGTVCDATQSVCVPCEGDTCGACTGELLCATPAPLCTEGTFPTLYGGCYTGACASAATCDTQACAALDQEACSVSETCEAVFQGVGCTDADGDPCSDQGACTCESFVYDRCVPAASPSER